MQTNGSRLWRLAYRFAGKQKTFALGSYPTVSLQKAREGRDAAKRLLAEGGLYPSVQRRRQRLAEKVSADSTFKTIALEYLGNRRHARSNVRFAAHHRRYLRKFLPHPKQRYHSCIAEGVTIWAGAAPIVTAEPLVSFRILSTWRIGRWRLVC